MESKRTQWVTITILLLGIFISFGFAQTTKRIAPESLLPRESLLYIGFGGSEQHADAWQQTAAHEALYESGLMDVVTRVFESVQQQSGGEHGVPGQVGAFVKHMMAHGASLSLSLGAGDGRPVIPWAVLVVHDAAPFEEGLRNLVMEAARNQIRFESIETKGRSVMRALIPQTPGIEVGWWSEGSHLVVVTGIDAVNSAIAVAEGGANITSNPLWTKYAAADPGFTVKSVGWLQFSTLLTTFGEIPIPNTQHEARPQGITVNDIATLLGLDGLKSAVMRTGFKGRALRSEINIDAPGPRSGLLAFSDQKTFTLADLPPMPANSKAFTASSFDWSIAFEQLLEIGHRAEQLLPPPLHGQIDQALAQVRNALGIDLKSDLFDPLGNIHVVYSDAGQMPFGLGFGVAIEVDDADHLRETANTLLRLAVREADGDLVIRRAVHDGHEVVMLVFGGGAASPAFCINDKWMVLGIVPQTVRAFLMRADGQLPRWEPEAEVRAALDELPAQFTSITVSDPRATYQFVLGIAPFVSGGFLSALRQSGGFPPGFEIPLTMADIPPAELVTRPLFPNVTVVGVNEDGVTYTSRASLSGIPLLGSMDGGTTVATVGVLTALLLPAVQSAREAARRTQSRNNLKQIMLALHNYHDVHAKFPEGTYANENLAVDERLSWLTRILPYIEQQNLYSQIDFDVSWDAEANQRSLQAVVPVFLNPSDPFGPIDDDGYAVTHYVGLAGLGEDGPNLPVNNPKAGMFAYDRATRIRDITDGTSNTIAISDGTPGAWGAGGTATIRPLTQQPYINGPDGIGGPHSGGIQAGFADGSVRFLSEDIDPAVMEALVTINGREAVGDF